MGVPRAEKASTHGRDRHRDPGLRRGRRGHPGCGPELRWAEKTKTGNGAGRRGSSQVLEPNQEFPRGPTVNYMRGTSPLDKTLLAEHKRH